MTTTILTILTILFGGTTAYLWFNRGKALDERAASKIVKAEAEKNKVRIELNDEQMDLIIQGFKEDPTKAARLTFYVGDKAKAEFNVASYHYRGDTCCV